MSVIMVLIASLMGSMHCAGMCGGFVALSCERGASRFARFGYHLGRLTTYLLLGAVAGKLGMSVDYLGDNLGITGLASYLTGGLLILAGLGSLTARRINLFKQLPYQGFLQVFSRVRGLNANNPFYPFAIGLCSTFLPCGWLYSYLAVAANSPSIMHSMLVMFFFWLGTLPMLVAIGSLARFITTPLKRFGPALASILMVAAGFWSLISHTPIGHKAGHCTKHHQADL